MATIRLYREEIEEGELPPFCMRCGAESTLVRRKRFSWGPSWVMILLVVGLAVSGPVFLIALFLIPFFLKRMRVPVPLCHRHRNHWLPLQVVLFGGLSIFALLFTCAIALFVIGQNAGDFWGKIGGWLLMGGFGVFVLMLFPAAIMQTSVIKAVEITKDSITLSNVSRKFVDQVEELDEEHYQARRRRKQSFKSREDESSESIQTPPDCISEHLPRNGSSPQE